MEIRKATQSDMPKIYNLWHKVKGSYLRIFGISDSIENEEVFVWQGQYGLWGFVRLNLKSNKTNSYIKINELYYKKSNEIEQLIVSLDVLLVKLGYLECRLTLPVTEYSYFSEYFTILGYRVKIAKNNTYVSAVVERKVELDNSNVVKIFGEYL